MKIIFYIVVFILVSSCASPKKVEQVSPSKNVNFTLPKYEIETLNNGLEVIFLKDSKLPLVDIGLLLPIGGVNDPKGQGGVAYFAGQLLKMGTHSRSAQKVIESFEQKGSSFSVSVSDDYTILSASALSQYLPELFDDFTEVLTQPKYSWKEFSRFKKKLIAQKINRLDDPSSIASTVMAKVIYKEHPYGALVSGNLKSIKRMSKAKVVSFYKKHYQPRGATLAVVGDFNKEEVMLKLNNLVKNWPSTAEVQPFDVPEVSNETGKIHLVHKPEAKQTQIRLGHLGISRNNKDFVPIRVMNAILGRGFSSRLLTEVRVKKGLTYSISSNFDSGKSQGSFVINTFTRHEKVKETLDTINATVKQFLTDGPTESELNVAKQYLKGVFPMILETPTSVAQNIMLLKYLGVPLDYLKNYTTSIDQVTVSAIKRVANEYISLKDLQVVLITDKEKVYDQVKEMGEVISYKHTDFK